MNYPVYVINEYPISLPLSLANELDQYALQSTDPILKEKLIIKAAMLRAYANI
jgi:hypothetical protein